MYNVSIESIPRKVKDAKTNILSYSVFYFGFQLVRMNIFKKKSKEQGVKPLRHEEKLEKVGDLLHRGKFKRAIRELQKELLKHPTFYKYHKLISAAYDCIQELDKVLDHAMKAVMRCELKKQSPKKKKSNQTFRRNEEKGGKEIKNFFVTVSSLAQYNICMHIRTHGVAPRGDQETKVELIGNLALAYCNQGKWEAAQKWVEKGMQTNNKNMTVKNDHTVHIKK
ncbi:hypothetical protein RFI_01506 [Reticulomyxa filosa]|uniref:Uncharacterized protein n=1 Tax=Reticulomyxa filosa TaxID=46433 RepID=X6PBQ7_RETFI|nr:hypothetical protein RFI_01506 [Reticulomyxa filosa]|eukprot:ETO35553.1 hypothetical protein RFI_01506 [Reticulomyxa filosa]